MAGVVELVESVVVLVSVGVGSRVGSVCGKLVESGAGAGFGSTTSTVRVVVPTFPAASVALYSIVCVPATDVSIVIWSSVIEAPPSTEAWMPRFWSISSETLAPRSTYESPTLMVAGLLPLTESTGGLLALSLAELVTLVGVVDAESALLELAAESIACSWDLVTQTSSKQSFLAVIVSALTLTAVIFFAKRSSMPLAALANHSVIREKRLWMKPCAYRSAVEVAEVEVASVVVAL